MIGNTVCALEALDLSGGLKSFDGSLKILEGRKEQSVEVGLQQGKGFYQWW